MADKKMVLQKEFERLYGDVDKLFKPVYDEQNDKFQEAIADLQKKGVSLIDINNVNQRAFAQPNNFSDNPEMRVLIVGDGKTLKYYRLEHSRDADLDLSDGENKLTQDEFEKLCIPTYTQPNPLMDKESTKLDYEPAEEEVKGSKAGPSKKMSVKKDEKPLGLKPDHPEVKKKTVQYGDTSSPKNKIKDDAGSIKEGKINEGSYYDFIAQYGQDIRQLLKKGMAMAEELAEKANGDSDVWEKLSKEKIGRVAQQFDKPVVHLIEKILGGSTNYDMKDVADIALDINNRWGTEMRMVVLAMEDVFGYVQSGDEIDETFLGKITEAIK